ncbi:MAG: phage terminase large subunit [Flavobacteriaceae bacterium]|nr:phage terminase large subunit [Flavobacteriaceae bacterium]
MSDLKISLLPWQKDVWSDKARFKVIAAGRRTGKSMLAAWQLLVKGLEADKGHVWYIAPTQQQARDIMWQQLLELGNPVIASSHVNNMQITLINGSKISLKGADRPETMRGVALKFVVLDEYADIKPTVFEQILRPALADLKGHCIFIGTPKGRNHFYDLYKLGKKDVKDWKSWHFTSFDNPLLDREEIEIAKETMSTFAFRQEFMANFEAPQSDIFKEDWVIVRDKEEEPDFGTYYMAVDLAGFENVSKQASNKKKYLDQTSIAIVKVGDDNKWWVDKVDAGRWDIKEVCERILKHTQLYGIQVIGIEKGSLMRAVMPYLTEMMLKQNIYPRIEEIAIGNRSKVDRVVGALQGRFEHKQVELCDGDWVKEFKDELLNFPTTGVHDDMVDSVSLIAQISNAVMYFEDFDEEYEPLDWVSGY